MKKPSEDKLFNSIDELPIFNWWKIIDTGDLNYLKKSNVYVPHENLHKKWEELNDEFFDIFGISDDFKDYLRKKKELLEYEIEYYLYKDPFLKTLIKIKQQELKEYEEREKTDYYVLKAHVEKHLGIKINPKETTVREYYSYLKSIENGG